MGRATSRPTVLVPAHREEINLEDAAGQYQQFKERWTEAYDTLKSQFNGSKSEEAEEAFRALQKSFQEMASLAELLRVENDTLKRDLENMKEKLTSMEEKLKESDRKHAELRAETTQGMADIQRQLEELRNSRQKAQEAGKAADDVTDKVNMILSASSNFRQKYGLTSTAFF